MWTRGILALSGLAAALPVADARPTKASCPRTLCIDGLNECATRWGGCYDVCQPTLSPTPPPCTTASPSTTFSSKGECASRTVCADYVNECGMMFGGCFPDCSPWPTFTPPPCPSSPDLPTTGIDSPITTEECMTQTVCVDYVNNCGMMYGSCFPNCKPWPTVTPLPCPDTKTLRSSSRSTTTTTTSECNTTVLRCEDYVNDCGQWYGGCFPDCKPYPTFTPPPCRSDLDPSVTNLPSLPSSTRGTSSDEITARPKSTEASAPTDECPWLCVDYLNDCGRPYGGCFKACPGELWPEFEDPGCPSTTSASSI